MPERQPVVLTVHNLTYQGECSPEWLDRMGPHGDRFAHQHGVRPGGVDAGGVGGGVDAALADGRHAAGKLRDEPFAARTEERIL